LPDGRRDTGTRLGRTFSHRSSQRRSPLGVCHLTIRQLATSLVFVSKTNPAVTPGTVLSFRHSDDQRVLECGDHAVALVDLVAPYRQRVMPTHVLVGLMAIGHAVVAS
jgi:hypothetical protein